MERGKTYPYNGISPTVHDSVFLAEGAIVIGDVVIGEGSSVWFNTVIRGDVHFIRIGERTNIQDGCVLHVTSNQYPLKIGSSVTVGHGAILHGCSVGDYTLIGMGARVLDDARVGQYCIVAAGTLVLEGSEIPDGSLVAGVPGRVRRTLTAAEKDRVAHSAERYLEYAKTYR